MRLDHLLSKEHLQITHAAYVVVGVCQEYMPVAQTQVLRRVLKGGISANSGCRSFPVLSTVPSFVGVPGRVLVWDGWFSVWHTVGS